MSRAMLLAELLPDVAGVPAELVVTGLVQDSRQLQPGDAFIAVLPNFITGNIPGLSGQLAYFLGGTSVLIVVGVAMDLVDRLNAQLVMRNYEGFMKGKAGGGGVGGAGWARK